MFCNNNQKCLRKLKKEKYGIMKKNSIITKTFFLYRASRARSIALYRALFACEESDVLPPNTIMLLRNITARGPRSTFLPMAILLRGPRFPCRQKNRFYEQRKMTSNPHLTFKPGPTYKLHLHWVS